MLRLGRVTEVKVLFLVMIFVFNFDLFKFSAAILEKGLFKLFFEEKNLFPKVSKITQKFTQNRQTPVVMVVSIEISNLALNVTEILADSLHVYPRLKSTVIRKFKLKDITNSSSLTRLRIKCRENVNLQELGTKTRE